MSAGMHPAAVLATAALALPGLGTWDRHEQRVAAHAGLIERVDGALDGARHLGHDGLRHALGALSERLGVPPAPVPFGTVTVARFDRALVEQLGLGDVARAVQQEAARVGLRPPARFGSEVVARQLGLRYNHPSGQDRLELDPGDEITRAEAAYSLARIARFDGWETGYARQVLGRFHLPRYTAAQKRVLRQAVARIGMPYVWGGEADAAVAQVHAGYDCSGFVWLVFQRAGVHAIGGRTTAAGFAGAIPRSRRIRLSRVRPADVLFFGPGRFRQRATERRIVHTGIALSRDFMIHASDQGVYVSPLFEDWRRHEFSWARRLL